MAGHAISVAIAAVLVTLGTARPLLGQELAEILSYDVTIEIGSAGTVLVTERIQVPPATSAFSAGIVRDITTSVPAPGGFGWREAPLLILAVERDGQPENFRATAIGGEIGRSGVRISAGRGRPGGVGSATYTLRYQTERWVTFGSMSDEFVWSVNGDGWAVPIRSVAARVRIEGLDAPLDLSAAVGPGTGATAEAEWDPAGEAVFHTTEALRPGQALTLRLVVPKFHIHAPSAYNESEWFRLDWAGWIDGGWALLLVIGVYAVMWFRVGVDRDSQPIVVQYEPPAGYSPAALGFLHARGYETRQFSATLVSMAVKGAIHIRRLGSRWELARSGATDGLTSDERRVFRSLLGDQDSFRVDISQHARLSGAAAVLRQALTAQLERRYFLANGRWFLAGLAVSVAGFAWLSLRWRFDLAITAWLLGMWVILWTALTATLLVRAAGYLRNARAGGGQGSAAAGGATALLAAPVVAAEWGLVLAFLEMVPTHLVVATLAIGITNVLFYHLLQRPTLQGRGILRQLEGFRLFLARVEADRFDRTHDPDSTPSRFERFLPHAIALGLENPWSARFGDAVTPPSVPGADAYDQGMGDALTLALSEASHSPR